MENRRAAIIWGSIIGLLLLGIGLGLIAAPQVALQYWYLLSVPLLLAALRFGFRGSLICAIACVAIFTLVFQSTWQAVDGQVTNLFDRVISASTNPEEAQGLVLQMVDLSTADPQTTFARSLTGLIFVIIGTTLLGASIDKRNSATRLQERAFNLLRRYFSPQIIDSILSRESIDDMDVGTERKEVTILFADLRGFTALSERLEPEETVTLLNEYFDAMTEEIFRQDGTLDKYIGDGIMAIFGDPVSYPDHPERAFKAAIAMQQRMRELQSYWRAAGREGTGMGVGISIGHAIVGNIGAKARIEYTAIGSTVNIASRMTDIALAGQIFTTRKTYLRVQHMVEGVPRESTLVKGFADPLEIVEILGARLVTRPSELYYDARITEVISRVVTDSAFRAMILSSPNEALSPYELSENEQQLAQQVVVLSGYPIFSDVPAEEISTLMASMSVEQYREGAVIVHQGAIEDTFYMISRGDVVVTVLDEFGREHHVASLATGDHFGEVALLLDTPRTATVRTSAPTTLLVLRRESFYRVMDAVPRLRERITAAANSRLRVLYPMAPPATADHVTTLTKDQ